MDSHAVGKLGEVHTEQYLVERGYEILARNAVFPGAEIDLIFSSSAGKQAFKIKWGLSPSLSKGYHLALADLSIEVSTVVYSGAESYRMARDAQVSSLAEVMQASAMGRMRSSASQAPGQGG